MDIEFFKLKHEKVQVIENHNSVTDTPIISVCVQTYKHKDFIRKCLDGILMQRTDFTFEILLGEDDSGDGTREICMEYARKYNDKIRLFLHHRENNIRVNGSPTGRFNLLTNLHCARGKYIAICEGDDYWTDPLKLQKQVEFLERNTGYSLCVGGYREINTITEEEQERIIIPNGVRLNDRGYSFTLDNTRKEWITKTLTSMFVNDKEVISKFSLYEYGRDVNLFYHLLSIGEGFYFTEIVGVYRVHRGGIFSLNNHGANLRNSHCVYRELHQENKDEFTRLKRLNSIADLINYNLYRFTWPGIKTSISLFSEMVGLIAKPRDLLQILLILPPPKVRGKIKPWFL